MPNDFFRFRQFTVYQDRAAMKVCTDACLFGAWVASFIDLAPARILDIGSGTGLLSLMLAQQWPAEIHAIDIDRDAYVQSRTNFGNSPWSGRLQAMEKPLQEYDAPDPFDLVICNPPFYTHDLKSPDEQRNVALHDTALSLEGLLGAAVRLLNGTGFLALLLPERRAVHLEQMLHQFDLVMIRKCGVKQTPAHTPFRYMYLIARGRGDDLLPETDVVIIRDSNGDYTDRFRKLLKDYYLFEK